MGEGARMWCRRRTCWAISLLLLGIGGMSPARALTGDAIDGWATRFRDAAASDNPDEIVSLLGEVRDDRLTLDNLKKVVSNFTASTSPASFEFTTKIEDETVGDLYRRFTTAAIYQNQHLYYTTTFMRGLQGWHLIFVQLNTDLNKVKALPWPQ